MTLISFLIFSSFLNVTNNLESSLFKFFGDLRVGIVWAKQILPLLSLNVKDSQFLYFPRLFGSSVKAISDRHFFVTIEIKK